MLNSANVASNELSSVYSEPPPAYNSGSFSNTDVTPHVRLAEKSDVSTSKKACQITSYIYAAVNNKFNY